MDAVDGVLGRVVLLIAFLRGSEEIDEGDAKRLRDLAHGLGVVLEQVVAYGSVREGGALAGEWGVENDLRCGGAVVAFALQVFEKAGEIGFETCEAFVALIVPGLVEAVAGEDDVGLGCGE